MGAGPVQCLAAAVVVMVAVVVTVAVVVMWMLLCVESGRKRLAGVGRGKGGQTGVQRPGPGPPY